MYYYHYAFDASKLLIQCLQEVQHVIESNERSCPGSSHSCLYDMREALVETERQLYLFFLFIAQKELEEAESAHFQELFDNKTACVDLASTVEFVTLLFEEHRPKAEPNAYYSSRNAADSLLFRLNVALQLCLVRLEDARLAICGNRRHTGASATIRMSKFGSFALQLSTEAFGMAAVTLFSARYYQFDRITSSLERHESTIVWGAKTTLLLAGVRWMHQRWRNLWMTTKIVKSTEAIEEWCRQWMLIIDCPTRKHVSRAPPLTREEDIAPPGDCVLDASRNRRLIEYALHETPKTSFWHSQGELRFLMLKHAMDVFYASVDTAMSLTNTRNTESESDDNDSVNWQVTLVTAAASSFYSLTGARERAAAVTSSSKSARSLIQNAWGMVSLPAVKNLSLNASRLLKGAAVADRIEICGVCCFVLSRDPAPELAAAIKRNRRMHQRRKPIATLSTIDEQSEHTPTPLSRSRKTFARSAGTRYRQRDVIFHLTGGGFFAHIIASDLPYLLDWSASTGAVVICPEYALLPDHTFPVALHQIEDVYQALVSGQADLLGFETGRIVVTGESAGGNLAASLCVLLATDSNMREKEWEIHPAKADDCNELSPSSSISPSSSEASFPKQMPNALMLSCPVLDLSLELSHSRVVGTEDPVLPSGLLSAISDAYLPIGVSKKEPLASPLYAPGSVLAQFPPTLLFASSNDPLLDDSVVFNKNLLNLGVESDLFAANNLPHAYLGLGTAGFPEARQVQEQCARWLTHQFTRDLDDGDGEAASSET